MWQDVYQCAYLDDVGRLASLTSRHILAAWWQRPSRAGGSHREVNCRLNDEGRHLDMPPPGAWFFGISLSTDYDSAL